MPEFSAEWLALREPVDHASINAEVRRAFCSAMPARAQLLLVDIGCGTGSNMRGLSPWLGSGQRWTLVDHDAGLLTLAAESATRLGIAHEIRQADLGTADLATLFAGTHAVTSAALFDLASDDAVERIADAVVDAGAVFYTVLTYDGIACWLPESAHAAGLRIGFNRHQRREKGLGPALGPHATPALKRAFELRGYRVITGPSPWVVTGTHSELRSELDRGWVAAAIEAGGVSPPDGAAWLSGRREDPDAVAIVGHQDLLALPR